MKLLKMVNLIRNENMKLYSRISTWVMIGLLILIVIGAGLATKFAVKSTENTDWKASLKTQNETYKTQIEQIGGIKTSRDTFEQAIKINEYRIEKDIPPVNNISLWGFVANCAGSISFIALFTIIIGAGIVASEFADGTIKLLLIRPTRRWKILLSKYITTLLSAIFMLIILFVFSFIFGGILFGFGSVSQPYLSYSNGTIREVSMVGHVFTLYGYNCVNLIMMATFAFMISTIFRNSSLAIGLSIFLMFTGNTIVTFLAQYDWVKYILFANTNLRMYSDGIPLVEGMTLGFSIIVLVVYFVIFNVISWLGFSKRDVAV